MLPFKICLDKLLKQPPTPVLGEKSTDERLATWQSWEFKCTPRSANV